MQYAEHSKGLNKGFLAEQMGKLGALRYAPQGELAINGVMEQWKRILERVGEMRFAATVRKCLETRSEFPSIPEFESLIPSGDYEVTHPRCDRCRDSEGWLLVKRPHPHHQDRTHIVAVKCRHN